MAAFTMAIAGVAAPASAAPGHGQGGNHPSAAAAHTTHDNAGTSDNAGNHDNGTHGTAGDPSSPQPLSRADRNQGGANGQCPGGPYCSTRDGSPSGNGNGGGRAVGKPCAGCVGRADNKNPKGQLPGPSDRNAGYECDRNHGIGRSNPAHTGCQQVSPPTGCTDDCGGEQPPGCTHDCGGEQPPGCTHDCGGEQPPGCTHDCGTTSPPVGCPGQPGMPAGQCQSGPPPVTTCLEAAQPCVVSPPRASTPVTAAGPHVSVVAAPRVVRPHSARSEAVRSAAGPVTGTLPNTGAPDTMAAELAGALLLLLGGLGLSARARRRRA